TGDRSSQGIRVFLERDGKLIADRTDEAKIVSQTPLVASVGAGYIVRAVGDGEGSISATLDGKQALATVMVKGAKTSGAPSFRNDVIPMMTKAGCNSGACHGALAGKGGLKLSLRGYAPAVDHFVLTRQADARRVDRVEPNQSLVLLKPTMAVTHGGGQRLEVGS